LILIDLEKELVSEWN